jgi:predicted DNA-binding antitoxin AbrB/MazE fold protein
MTITVPGVYEGDGVVKLDQPVALKANTKVHVTIEAEAPSPDDDDPTGWKMADELIGFMKDGPKGPIGAEHDEHLYRK